MNSSATSSAPARPGSPRRRRHGGRRPPPDRRACGARRWPCWPGSACPGTPGWSRAATSTSRPTVLDAIGRALRLGESERAHAYLLAGLNPPRTGARRDAEVTPELRRLLDTWTPPAMLRDRYWNMIAANEAAQRTFRYGDTDHNCLIAFFTNTRYRAMHVEVGVGRARSRGRLPRRRGPRPRRPGVRPRGGRPGAVSPEFAELWDRRRGARRSGGQGDPPPRGRRPVLRHDHPGRGRPPTTCTWSSTTRAEGGGATP